MAGRYPPQWLDELRARADIVKVIGSYVTLKKNGHRYVGLCPFHNETAPSFSVDEQKQVYHCFGCKAGGSVIQFVMDIERLSFPEAVAFLADQLHMPLPEMQTIRPMKNAARSRSASTWPTARRRGCTISFSGSRKVPRFFTTCSSADCRTR